MPAHAPLSPPIITASDLALASFYQETTHASAIQSRLLADILRRNSDTEYLRRFRLPDFSSSALDSGSDPEAAAAADEYRRRVPLITHSDIKPYFDRIADGDTSPILVSRPVHSLSLSSGTTSDGQQKYVVLYEDIVGASLKLATISGAFRSKAYPIRSGKKLLDLVFAGKLWKTSGGITVGTATTHLFRSNEFKNKYKSANVTACSPSAVVAASTDNREAMYCHLLSALICRDDIEFVHSTFAYTILEALTTLERDWRSLVQDICSGVLSDSAVKEATVRDAMAPLLHRPDPALADTLTTIFLRHEHSSSAPPLIPELWPNCKYVLSIMTGAMEPYLPKLQSYAGDLPLVTTDYGASETWIGVNTNPKAAPRDVTFTVVPSFAYFEFLPVNADAQTVGLTDVKVGREYEIIVTTHDGLYRYRVGDVVRVAGFYNQSPQLSYVCRKNVILTVNIDKTTERDLQNAVESGMARLTERRRGEEEGGANATVDELELVDYTSYAELQASRPGHYVIFVELRRRKRRSFAESVPPLTPAELEELATAVDAAFVDPGYVGPRKMGSIAALELCVVEEGTFRSLLERYLARGTATISQYKTPRCLSSEEVRRLMRRCVTASARSSAYLKPAAEM